MGIEIEKKFEVRHNRLVVPAGSPRNEIFQGYIPGSTSRRIRIIPQQCAAIITEKVNIGTVDGIPIRQENEYPMDYIQGLITIFSLDSIIWKDRFIFPLNEMFTFEVDVFRNLSFPLTVAEIEMDEEQVSHFKNVKLPPWIGRDISDDPQLTNYSLSSCTDTESAKNALENRIALYGVV